MADLVGLDGKPIDEAPHIADCPEVLRLVAERMDAGGDLADAEHVLVLVMLKDGAKYLAHDRGQTIATTLFMLECEKADLLDRARMKDR
jgi:hypothetical protein